MMKNSQFFRRLALAFALLLPFLLVAAADGPCAAGEKKNAQNFKPVPLDWDWKSAETAALKTMVKEVKTNADGSFEYDGPSWVVQTYHSPRFTVQVSQYMEMFTDIFMVAFQFQKESDLKDFKPRMIVFASESAYQALVQVPGSAGVFMPMFRTEKTSGKLVDAKLTLATYYSSVEKEPSFDKKAPLGVIQHEATHCLLQKIYGSQRIPVWLNEGTATYYESWNIRLKISEDDTSSANVKARDDRRKHSWRPMAMQYFTKRKNGELPRLDYLTSLTTGKEWNVDGMGDETSYNYCIAESFMDYLMNSKNRRPFLYAIMQRLHDGEKVIITPEEQLQHEKDWLQFLNEKWGVAFDKIRIQQRVEELKKRAAASKDSTGKSSAGKPPAK